MVGLSCGSLDRRSTGDDGDILATRPSWLLCFKPVEDLTTLGAGIPVPPALKLFG